MDGVLNFPAFQIPGKSMTKPLFVLLLLFSITGQVFAYTADDYYHSGIVLYKQKQYDKSVEYFRYAIQLDPNHWQSYQAMGQAYYMMGDTQTALAMFGESLRIHPGNNPLKHFVAYLQAKNSPPTNPTPSISGSILAAPGQKGVSQAVKIPNTPPDISSILENNKIFARVGGGYYSGFFGDLNSWQPGDTTGKQTNALGYNFKTEIGYSFDPFLAIGISLETVTGGQVQRTDTGAVTVQTISPQLFSASVVAYNFWPDNQGRWFVEIGAGYYATTVTYVQWGVTRFYSNSASLSGSTFGSSCYAGREFLLFGVMGLNLEGGFHFATINSVTGASSGGTGTQTLVIDQLGQLFLEPVNSLGTNGIRPANIDFSGFSFGASLEFDFQ